MNLLKHFLLGIAGVLTVMFAAYTIWMWLSLLSVFLANVYPMAGWYAIGGAIVGCALGASYYMGKEMEK